MPAKRGYRHHPRADLNAPKRPYSAYMLFSNHIRTLPAAENLEFRDISKQVGRRWQALNPEEKNVWNKQAKPLWERYRKDVARYQGTKEYAEYQRYLESFSLHQPSGNARNIRGATESQEDPVQNNACAKGTVNMYPTPGPTPESTVNALSDMHGSMASPVAPSSRLEVREGTSSQASKEPVQERRDVLEEPTDQSDKKARSKQACEPCRRRKTKCDGEKPTCGHCLASNLQCHYSHEKQMDKRCVTHGVVKINQPETDSTHDALESFKN